MHIIEKKIHKTLGESGKYEFMDNSLAKCSRTSKKINTVTDFIFDQVKSDANTHSLDVLSICGMLLSFAVNSQSHLYLAMENIKKAADILSKIMILKRYFLSNLKWFRIPKVSQTFRPSAMLFLMDHLIWDSMKTQKSILLILRVY